MNNEIDSESNNSEDWCQQSQSSSSLGLLFGLALAFFMRRRVVA